MVDFLLVYYSGIFCTWPTTGSLYIYIYIHTAIWRALALIILV